jgi:hypothetical protein
MGLGFFLRRAKDRTGYQTTRQNWPMACSQHARAAISLAQSCRNLAQATKHVSNVHSVSSLRQENTTKYRFHLWSTGVSWTHRYWSLAVLRDHRLRNVSLVRIFCAMAYRLQWCCCSINGIFSLIIQLHDWMLFTIVESVLSVYTCTHVNNWQRQLGSFGLGRGNGKTIGNATSVSDPVF